MFVWCTPLFNENCEENTGMSPAPQKCDMLFLPGWCYLPRRPSRCFKMNTKHFFILLLIAFYIPIWAITRMIYSVPVETEKRDIAIALKEREIKIPVTSDVIKEKKHAEVKHRYETDPHQWENALRYVEPSIASHDVVAAESFAKDDVILYFITPTYRRALQMVDLIRLSQTLMHDRGIYWIVIEDETNCTGRVRQILERSGLLFAHVPTKTPEKEMNRRPRGLRQRNRGLEIVQEIGVPGVVYFADDDNAYDIRLFEELRKTQYVGVFGVGFAGGGMYERCVVNEKTGKVSHFVTNWKEVKRKFSLDMAGFACHTRALQEHKPRFQRDWQKGMLETKFVEQMVSHPSELEPLNNNCTSIYVWHVRTAGARSDRIDADKAFDIISKLV